VTKLFMGGDFPLFKKEVAAHFAKVHVVRPRATREHSYECYVVGTGFK
jgi:23S rRNA (uridine2552-2'-O)-methyltransferase